MNSRPLILAALLTPAVALAQTTSARLVRGTVDKIDATSISLRTDAGGTAESYKLAPNVLVIQYKPATLADIRPNDFVASAAVTGPDHKLHSTEVRIFPEAMRGVGEGQKAMNDPRNQTMTNATVTGAAVVNGSNDIKVTFNGRESELVVDPGVPVTRIDTADIGLVKSGEKVQMRVVQSADGASVNRITLQ